MAITSPIINLVAHPKMVLPKLFTFTRNSQGAYITQQESLKIAAIDTPRLGFEGKTDEFTGLMLENSTINRLKSNNVSTRDFTTASWTRSGVTVSQTAYGLKDESESGSRLASLVTTSGSAGSVKATLTGLTPGSTYTISVYAKRISGTGAFKFIGNNVELTSSFNPTSDLAGTTFYRYYTKFSASASTCIVGISIPANNSFVFDYIQVELGNLTSIVPGSLANRATEALVLLENNAASLVKPFEGTFYLNLRFNENSDKIANQSYSIMNVGNSYGPIAGTNLTSTTLSLGANTSSSPANNKFTITASPGTDFTQDTITTREYHKIALTYKSTGNLKLCVDGKTPIADSSVFNAGISPENYGGTLLRINPFDGGLLHFAYFGTAFGDADLVSLTS
jgi:hypothetical protein